MTPDSKRFRELSPFLADSLAEVTAGASMTLAVLHYVDTGSDTPVGVIFEADYVHEALVYRTPGKRDAMATGRASTDGGRTYDDVRIYFSAYHQTAAIRGIAVDGNVKKL